MIVPDLSAMLVSAASVFSLAVKLVFVAMGCAGLWIGGRGLYGAYGLAAGEHRFSNRSVSLDAVLGQLALGAAMIVAPVMLWRFAGALALGGRVTSSLFSYAPADGAWCQQVYRSVSYLFMALGAAALMRGALVLNAAARGQHPHGVTTALGLFVAGTACFFVNDIAGMISATVHMKLTLANVCTVMGGG